MLAAAADRSGQPAQLLLRRAGRPRRGGGSDCKPVPGYRSRPRVAAVDQNFGVEHRTWPARRRHDGSVSQMAGLAGADLLPAGRLRSRLALAPRSGADRTGRALCADRAGQSAGGREQPVGRRRPASSANMLLAQTAEQAREAYTALPPIALRLGRGGPADRPRQPALCGWHPRTTA